MALFAACALLLSVVASPMLPACAARSSRHLLANGVELVQLDGHVPTWATSGSFIGVAPSADVVHANLHFGYSDPAAVAALADAVSYTSSRHYGKHLTVKSFTKRFAPPVAYVSQVAAWAKSQGLHVAYVPANRKFIALEGDVARFSAALHTTFGLYDVDGVPLRAPASDPHLPARLVGAHSLAFEGLDHGKFLGGVKPLHVKAKDTATPPIDAKGKLLHPGSLKGCAWTDAKTLPAGCYYTPQQLRSAYSIPTWLTGKGQTVAVIDYYGSPTAQADLDLFSVIMGMPSTTIQFEYPPFQYDASENPPPGYDSGWAVEESLDLQSIHGLAPDAKLVYLGADPYTDPNLFAALNYVLEKNLASIVSNSYGSSFYNASGELSPDVAAQVPIFNDLAKQAAVLGIGLYYATGDTGEYQPTDLFGQDVSPSWFAVDPYVTAVGGTTLAVGSKGQYLHEYGWSSSFCNSTDPADPQCSPDGGFEGIQGAGGGIGYTFATPTYQQLIGGPKRILQSAGYKHGRVIPDVAALADPYTGYLIAVSSIYSLDPLQYIPQLYVYGGTSLACPLFAAMVAMKQQLKKTRLGFANPYFYSRTGQFRDIIPGPPIVLGYGFFYGYYEDDEFPASLETYRGYDNVTGIGSPGPAFWYHNG